MTEANEKLLKTDAGNIEIYHEDYAHDVRYNQPDVQYDPTGGGAGVACSNCRWFDGLNHCHVVKGAIAPNGICEIHDPIAGGSETEIEIEIEGGESENIQDIVQQLVNDGILEEASIGKAVMDYIKSLFKPSEDVFFDAPSGFKMRGNQWVAWYTNAYKDRDGEWFATKAIESDIATMWKAQQFPELWYWHINGTKHGQATWVGMIGRYAVAIGEFDNTPAAKAFKRHYQKQPHQLSHGFRYDPKDKKNGVYYKYHTFEISPLPAGKEANELTTFAIKSGENTMKLSKEQFESLASIVGVDDAIKMVGQGYNATKEADEHLSYKAAAPDEEKPADEKAGDYKAMEARMSKMESMMQKLMKKMDMGGDDEEAKPAKKEAAQPEDISEQFKAMEAKQAEFAAFMQAQQERAKTVQGFTFADILADYQSKSVVAAQPQVPLAVQKGVKALTGQGE